MYLHVGFIWYPLKGNFSEKFSYVFTVNLQSNTLKVFKKIFVKIKKRCLGEKNALKNGGSLATAAIFEFTSI